MTLGSRLDDSPHCQLVDVRCLLEFVERSVIVQFQTCIERRLRRERRVGTRRLFVSLKADLVARLEFLGSFLLVWKLNHVLLGVLLREGVSSPVRLPVAQGIE